VDTVKLQVRRDAEPAALVVNTLTHRGASEFAVQLLLPFLDRELTRSHLALSSFLKGATMVLLNKTALFPRLVRQNKALTLKESATYPEICTSLAAWGNAEISTA